MNSCVSLSVSVSEQGGCETFIIHARKAWLSGLSPKENREIPPLDYERVYQLKRDFPHLTMSINGGIKSLEEAKVHLQHMDGVMMGREAYQNPGMLAQVDREMFGSELPAAIRWPWCGRCIRTSSAELAMAPISATSPAICLGLFQGIPGARQWRRHLSENAHKAGADIEMVEQALRWSRTKSPPLFKLQPGKPQVKPDRSKLRYLTASPINDEFHGRFTSVYPSQKIQSINQNWHDSCNSFVRNRLFWSEP